MIWLLTSLYGGGGFLVGSILIINLVLEYVFALERGFNSCSYS